MRKLKNQFDNGAGAAAAAAGGGGGGPADEGPGIAELGLEPEHLAEMLTRVEAAAASQKAAGGVDLDGAPEAMANVLEEAFLPVLGSRKALQVADHLFRGERNRYGPRWHHSDEAGIAHAARHRTGDASVIDDRAQGWATYVNKSSITV